MARRIKARTLLKLFADDAAKTKTKRLRAAMVGIGLVRRDARGRVVVDNELREHRGKPPETPGGRP